MADAIKVNTIGYEGGSIIVLARILLPDGTVAQQADISAIAYQVWETGIDSTNPRETKTTTSLTIANVIFNTLQTDSRWTADGTGYNFAYEVPPDAFPKAFTTSQRQQKFQIDFLFTPASGEKFRFSVIMRALKVYGTNT